MLNKKLFMLMTFVLITSFTHSFAKVDDTGPRTDLDEEIQGSATSVTRHNLCVEEKLKAFNPIQGTIPLVAGSLAASDLVCDSDECGVGVREGDTMTPSQSKAYFLRRFSETRCMWDLSKLLPTENTDIWTNKKSTPLNPKLDNLDVRDELDKLHFVSQAWGRLGSYRITVNKYIELDGTPTQFSMILSKTIHNYILRKSLLRKLGYKIPPVKYLKTVKVKFDNKKQRKEFISKLSINNAGSFDRWVLSQTNNNEVVLQDVIIMEGQEFDLNLAKGYVSGDISEGKRIYDSLLIPFNLVEVPESINMFEWTFGREYSNNIVVKYPLARDFQTSFHDAVWISKKIMKLTDADWWDIVESTHLPSSVKLLLFNKLKSRRNHLGQLFGIDNVELSVDTKVSNQEDLVDGVIVKEFYDGFARRFKMPDPESPINSDQMKSFFTSKAISQGLSLMGQALNSQDFMGTDIAGQIDSKISDIMAENVAKSIVTGNVSKTPIKSFIFPTVQGSLVLNREIIAGGYLGTDNRLQLVDSIGGVLSAGLFGGMTGIYTKTGKKITHNSKIIRQKLPVSLSAQAKITVSRVYSHIRPIMTIEQGLKFPYKNMFVPNILKANGNVFNSLLTDEFQVSYENNPEKGIAKMVELLNKHIEIGESVIITDSLGGDISANVGFNLYELVNLKLGVAPKRVVLNRLHILRRSEDEFHIYKSLGNVGSVELTAGLEKYIPLTKIIFKLSSGTARTKYYRVRIGATNKYGEDNYNRDDKIKALGAIFSSGSLASLDTVQKPDVVVHKFDEDSTKFGIFVWRWNWLDQNDAISVSTPEGTNINLFRRLEGYSKGRDYENYAKDVIKGLAGELLDFNFGFRSFRAGNAGFTYFGKAKNEVAVFEGIKTKDGRLVKPYMKFSRIRNGWKQSKESAVSIINGFNERYRHKLFDEETLQQTDALFLYNINVNFFIHTAGIEYILSQSNKKISNIWNNHRRFKRSNSESLKTLLKKLKWYKKYNERREYDEMAERGLSILKIIEKNLTMDGISSMFGGGTNIMAIGKIEGYRIGDENGDQAIISNSEGREGNNNLDGPVGSVKKFLGMTSGEFYINWLLGRVI